MIQPTASFKDNLKLLPPVEDLARIDLIHPAGVIVATIENQPGKQGSLAVYQYLQQCFEVCRRAKERSFPIQEISAFDNALIEGFA